MNFLKPYKMESVHMGNTVLNIDKTDWKLVKLGDILNDISKRVDNPSQSSYERFVGLEHFVSGDIKIKYWGATEKLTSSTKAFKAGDILFARRNAYLRRASLVDFDGCCSGDAFVLRENHEKVVPGFLVFFLNSNALWDFANENAAGTMSKRVKWRDLANFELLLPPKNQQSQLAELLLSMDDIIEKEIKVNSSLIDQMDVYLNKAFRYGAFLDKAIKNTSYGEIPENWRLKKLEEIGSFKNGINKDKEQFGYGKPFVNLMDIFGYRDLFSKDFELVNVNQKELVSFDIQKGDVLFVRSSVKPSGVGLTTLIQETLPDTVYSGFIIRFRPETDELLHNFRKHCFYEKRFRVNLRNRSTISANTNINQESLKKLELPVPPIEEQEEFEHRMGQYEELISLSEKKVSASKMLQRNLISQVF